MDEKLGFSGASHDQTSTPEVDDFGLEIGTVLDPGPPVLDPRGRRASGSTAPAAAIRAIPGPLPLQTPPPRYDKIVGTPSVDGLADYFARLAVYDGMARGEEEPPVAAAELSESDSDTNTSGPNTQLETTDPAAGVQVGAESEFGC